MIGAMLRDMALAVGSHLQQAGNLRVATASKRSAVAARALQWYL